MTSQLGRIRRLLALSPALLLLAWSGSLAVAQDVAGATTTGTISGDLGDETAQWRTLGLETPDGPQNTANFTRMFGASGPHSFSIQGHRGDSYVAGSLSITFATYGGPPADCPCSVSGDITYWSSGSVVENLYTTSDARITIDSTQLSDTGEYSLTGTARGQLLFLESVGQQPDPDRVLDVALSFQMDRVSENVIELD